MLMYSDHILNCLDFCYGLLSFLILAAFQLCQKGHILEFRAFPWECMGVFKFGMLVYSDDFQKWLDVYYGLLIFFFLVAFWLCDKRPNVGALAIFTESMRGMAWNLACWCILSTFKTWSDFGHGMLLFLIYVVYAPWLHDNGIWRLRGTAAIRSVISTCFYISYGHTVFAARIILYVIYCMIILYVRMNAEYIYLYNFSSPAHLTDRSESLFNALQQNYLAYFVSMFISSSSVSLWKTKIHVKTPWSYNAVNAGPTITK